ncbi:MAG: YraN family protein [Granulosicoccus sp.]
MDSRHKKGQLAERRACQFLESHGLACLERNYRLRIGEIDLVMQEPASGTIVFVEVRYRQRRNHCSALESIDHRKQAKLRRTARAWLQQHADDRTSARIDVVVFDGDDAPQWIINAIED